MSKKENLILLIHSMSKSEKRYFRLFTSMQDGKKDYLTLFDIIEQKSEFLEISEEFKNKCPKASLDNTGSHLFNVLLKSLRTQSSNKHIDLQLSEHIQNYTILYKKEIYDECFKILDKAIKTALKYQVWYWLALLFRKQLDWYSQTNYFNLEEDELIGIQNEAEAVIEKCKSIHQHARLYELINLHHQQNGYQTKISEVRQTNELAFFEMQLFNKPRQLTYEVKKLHLLFQSIYFKVTGDKRSALRTLFELNELFENNSSLWNNPPRYYLQHIKMMMFTLRELNENSEMGYFLNRLEKLQDEVKDSDIVVKPLLYIFEMLKNIDAENYMAALSCVEAQKIFTKTNFTYLSPQTKAEIIFVQAIAYHGAGKYLLASKQLIPMLSMKGVYDTLPIFRNIRLFNLIVCFDMNKYDYLRSELRSFERIIKSHHTIYKTEQLLFRFIRRYINNLSNSQRRKMITELIKRLEIYSLNPHESHIFSYFNYLKWSKRIRL